MLHIATDVNDLILDSFLGSGTTAAVAHKMGRRWIGIELGDHAVTHCVPRLKKVIDGQDAESTASPIPNAARLGCGRILAGHRRLSGDPIVSGGSAQLRRWQLGVARMVLPGRSKTCT